MLQRTAGIPLQELHHRGCSQFERHQGCGTCRHLRGKRPFHRCHANGMRHSIAMRHSIQRCVAVSTGCHGPCRCHLVCSKSRQTCPARGTAWRLLGIRAAWAGWQTCECQLASVSAGPSSVRCPVPRSTSILVFVCQGLCASCTKSADVGKLDVVTQFANFLRSDAEN
jgi:hypothetical protein